MIYKDYLKSEKWQVVRNELLIRKQNCSVCNNKNVDIHHLTYKNIGNEKKQDLIRLCRDCHFTAHNLFKEGKVKYKNHKISLLKFRERSYFSQIAILKLAIKKARGFGIWNKANHFIPKNMFIEKNKGVILQTWKSDEKVDIKEIMNKIK